MNGSGNNKRETRQVAMFGCCCLCSVAIKKEQAKLFFLFFPLSVHNREKQKREEEKIEIVHLSANLNFCSSFTTQPGPVSFEKDWQMDRQTAKLGKGEQKNV